MYQKLTLYFQNRSPSIIAYALSFNGIMLHADCPYGSGPFTRLHLETLPADEINTYTKLREREKFYARLKAQIARTCAQ